jgi:hypothetical protein
LENNRLIIYHKQSTSARILFFALDGSVCHFGGLPPESQIVESSIEEDRIVDYPETLIAESQKQLELSDNILAIEPNFKAVAKNSDLITNVYLANFTTVDVPREQLAHLEGKFIAITEARRLPAVELELLGLVYTFLMD